MIEIHYVWEWPVRLTHWINVLCVVTLSLTGFYIAYPFAEGQDTASYVMGWVRVTHTSTAYLFTVSVLVRFLWAFIGNRYASWRAFFPWLTKKGRKDLRQMFRYYTFTGRKITYDEGHNPLAAVAYLLLFILFLFQIVSGFALYSQSALGGFFDTLFGPLNILFGNQYLRLVHHLVTWLIAGFVINHIYSAWLMDVKERNGTMSAIFGGRQFIEPKELR